LSKKTTSLTVRIKLKKVICKQNEKLKKVNDKIDKAISLIKVEVKNG